MTSQVVNGKGFEWIVASTVANRLGGTLNASDEVLFAAACFDRLTVSKQKSLRRCAEESVDYILEQENVTADSSITVALLSDSAGSRGDVRDVVLSVGDRQIGISCKTNHEAFKHPRLSGTIDFIKEWGLGGGCSEQYWSEVRPIFDELRSIKNVSKGTATWSGLGNYQAKYYHPVLRAWKDEVLRTSSASSDSAALAAQGLCSYVIGRIDFWKVIARPDEVKLYAFNTNRSLATKKTKLPNRILGIDDSDGSQYSLSVRLNEGFQFNFRLHNASSRVEASLKFDVQSTGLPPQIHQHEISI